jgi:hypothetical protein
MSHQGTMDVTADWFYEDRVVEALVSYLRREGWTLGHLPSAQKKEQGVDITATRSGKSLLIEAKGYPSAFYRDEKRRHEKKRTDPNNQAQQWYSHALLKVLRLQTKRSDAHVAMAFPDFPRYRQLFMETAGRLELLEIQVFFIGADGIVSIGKTPTMCIEPAPTEPVRRESKLKSARGSGGKYSELSEFFRKCVEQEVALSFEKLDSLVGGLPNSARTYREWWANHKSNPQAVWLAHGYKVSDVSFEAEHVSFCR